MAIYTGVADANGDFTVPFSSSYTSGQKVTVTAEKDAATKSIELHAPSEVVGGGAIRFSGNMLNFPANIGNITLSSDISGIINQGVFEDRGSYYSLWAKATGLTIQGAITQINQDAFKNWAAAQFLHLPTTLVTIGVSAFYGWINLQEINIPDSVTTIGNGSFYNIPLCKKIKIGAGCTHIGFTAFLNAATCDEIIVRATTPPALQNNSFASLNASCIFKVPAASVAAYQAAPNWSTFASRIQAI